MTKLLIEINNDGEKCGECEYKIRNNFSDVSICRIFKDETLEQRLASLLKPIRRPSCIQAEKDAKDE